MQLFMVSCVIRCVVLGGLLFGGLLLVGCQPVAQPQAATAQSSTVGKTELIVGTYNQKGSQGIYGVTFDAASQKLQNVRLLASADNPSYLAPTKEYVYAVNEVEAGRVSAYSKKDGLLTLKVSTEVMGASPCYVTLSPNGQQLATANYMGGNVSVFDMRNGEPEGPIKVLQHSGAGPNQSRQEAPHAHWVQWHPSQPFLYAVDLGIDEVKVYDTSTWAAQTAIKLSPGDGPRHMVFHPSQNTAFILNELSNTLASVRWNTDGTLTELSRTTTLPKSFTEHSQAAHIAISDSGEYVYVSNRGHNSIAVFRVSEGGKATLIQHKNTEGNWPRHFSLVESNGVIFVANQESNNIVAFALNTDGTLGDKLSETEVIQPTFVGGF